MDNALKNSNYIKWLLYHWTPLLAVQIVAIGASIVFSMPYFMQYQYKSSGILYPYNMTSLSRESATEQMMQFLNSVDVKNDVIKDFNLIAHYDIDIKSKNWYTKLLDTYDRNVSISSTEFEAAEITVYDRSPDTASKLVQDIIKVVNNKVLATQKEKSIETVKETKRLLDIKKRQIDSLSALSKQISVQYGILDYGNQTREVIRAYYGMLSASKSGKPLDEAATQIKNLEEKGQEYKNINSQLDDAVSKYEVMLLTYQNAMADANKQITYTNIVANPYPADTHTYPIRWLIVFLSCVSSFFVSVVILKLIEKAKE